MKELQYLFLAVDPVNEQSLAIAKQLIDKLLHASVQLVYRIIIAIVVFIVLSWIIKWIRKGVSAFLTRRKIDDTVKVFLDSVVNIGLKIVLLLSVISIIGISTTSFTAILAAAGLAVGMAMKDNLSNFAGGVMLLINKPFKNGDKIQAQSIDGVVQSIGILYTTLLTADNRTVYIPNGPLSTGTIANFSRQTNRRIDKKITVKHGVQIDQVKEIIETLLKEDTRILKQPEPFIGVTNVTAATFDVSIRVWVRHENYEKVNVNLNELIYTELIEKEIYKEPK